MKGEDVLLSIFVTTYKSYKKYNLTVKNISLTNKYSQKKHACPADSIIPLLLSQ